LNLLDIRPAKVFSNYIVNGVFNLVNDLPIAKQRILGGINLAEFHSPNILGEDLRVGEALHQQWVRGTVALRRGVPLPGMNARGRRARVSG
jgi:hypothetical protein